jgi:hypothetical protein
MTKKNEKKDEKKDKDNTNPDNDVTMKDETKSGQPKKEESNNNKRQKKARHF